MLPFDDVVQYHQDNGTGQLLGIVTYGNGVVTSLRASVSPFLVDAVEWDCSFSKLPNADMDAE